MSENNILKQPFGMNIKMPTRTIQQGKETVEKHVGGVFEPLFSFIEDNQPVFNGSIAEEIEKYNLMTYNTGAMLRNAQAQITFDIKG